MSKFPACVLWSTSRSEPLIAHVSPRVIDTCLAALPKDGSQIVTIDGQKARAMRKSLGIYSALALAFDEDRIKSKKLIEADLDGLLAAASTIDASLQRAEARTRRLLHNLKSLTAKASQEVFNLARQDRLIGSPREAVPYLASEIKDNVEGTARALLEILKHQSAQKAEYIAFDRLSGKFDQKTAERHDIHRVLMNVFYLFFGEFIERKVRAEVDRTQVQGHFDYDSIHVCIYYLVENAAKYVAPRSDFRVTVREDGNKLVDIRFDMESLAIMPDEQEKVFHEGYSGVNAQSEKLHGAGIGLYLARAMARLNGGQLNLIAGQPTKGSKYARNTFILTLPAVSTAANSAGLRGAA